MKFVAVYEKNSKHPLIMVRNTDTLPQIQNKIAKSKLLYRFWFHVETGTDASLVKITVDNRPIITDDSKTMEELYPLIQSLTLEELGPKTTHQKSTASWSTYCAYGVMGAAAVGVVAYCISKSKWFILIS